jgi:pectate lyase
MAAPPAFAGDGFGARATGGAGGASVSASTAGDLTTFATSALPYVITVSGTITLSGNLRVASNKTIQGADSNATIIGNVYIGSGVSNVVVRFLNITNPTGVGDGDGITVINGAKNVFITHCTFTDCADGELDITNQSDSVTVSWCRFRYVTQAAHRNLDLIGSSDAATNDLGYLHVTVHHCWFDQLCSERMPSVRFGRVHVYNNYYSAAGNNYCVRTRLYAECLVESNFFENVQNPWELLMTTGTTGKLRAVNNNVSYLDTSFGVTWVSGWYTGQSLLPGTDSVFLPPYPYTLTPLEALKDTVVRYAGNTGQDIPLAVAGVPGPVGRFSLYQNYPNPFNSVTIISFDLPEAAFVSVRIVDLLGRVVSTVVSENLEGGSHRRYWDGAGMTSGVYLVRLQSGTLHATTRLILLK